MERRCDWIEKVTGGKLVGVPTDALIVIQGVSTDTRQLAPHQLYVPLIGEKFDGHQFIDQAAQKGAAAALWQEDHPLPDIDLPLIVVPDTLKALQAMANAYRKELGIPIVAVTGSNGKTTTKDLIASVLSVSYHVHKTKGNLNNHIGVPLTLLSIPEQAEIAVVEMGMNHRGEIALLSRIAEPNAAVITNIGESHIEFLGSREGIAQAKLEIREGLEKNGPIFFDGDEPLLQMELKSETRPLISVGWNQENVDTPVEVESAGFEGFRFVSSRTGYAFRLPLLGRHNVINALLAINVGRHFGLRDEQIAQGLAEVKLTGMRLELKTAQNGMRIINDAYNASPTSMRAAIDLLIEIDAHLEKWVLLGDMREIGEKEEIYHREIGEYAVKQGVSRIYTVGNRGRWIAEGARNVNRDKDRVIQHFASLDEASQWFAQNGNPGVILLVKASRAAQLDRVVHHLTEGE
ncbi:UDP-N-acetylmuramoyl-tripeptide--D-alanyl-D-alanine ligase [Thermoflavimicrobium dichotomicum]|uniref:UDP-N-acetylmuramoyl-tripeptide--D-alanyl-D-alanine ligase n=1 Tax=Thermoflavimicrobium dichotomicum TaxID=46223 RepID=A0A1I3N6E8_9BACL|nr:UDP-N-acetylmuramoyl-tripeptide--D-alanyl-D-alanine ligase [Thermoflavimicrobium dichotomicum]SFJ04665.1 UDP-N-acetylmuramoyl-tripeptide--D-alanyl-D-alanine ligase [Thermoflavimicrobium dichotomicum]